MICFFSSFHSATDAWAVGNYTSGQNQAAVLILHWDGSTWSRATSPRVSSTFTELRGVSADSATDASAVGRYLNRNTGIIDTLALHWDGASWSKVHSPSPSMTNNALNAVSALSPTDAWSAGAYNPTVDVIQTMTDYWNGTAWSKVTSPNPDSSDSELHGVSAYSPIASAIVSWQLV